MFRWTAHPPVGTFKNATDEDTAWTAPGSEDSSENVRLYLTVTDTGGQSTSRFVNVNYSANRAPTVTLEADSMTVVAGGSVALDATVMDPEGQELTYAWIATPNTGSFLQSEAEDTVGTPRGGKIRPNCGAYTEGVGQRRCSQHRAGRDHTDVRRLLAEGLIVAEY